MARAKLAKYYVNAIVGEHKIPFQYVVIAESPIDAVVEALARDGFGDPDVIPDNFFCDNVVYVDERGYRNAEPFPENYPNMIIVDSYGHISDNGQAEHMINGYVALARYDILWHKCDPFCTDQYYEELGEDENI